MKLGVYCVRDIASDQFGNPMFLMADGQAVRAFGIEVNRADQESMIYMHPDDFELFKLGEFDTADGSFACHSPVSLATGKMMKVRS